METTKDGKTEKELADEIIEMMKRAKWHITRKTKQAEYFKKLVQQTYIEMFNYY